MTGIQKTITSPRNRRFMYLSILSLLTSVMGFTLLQMAGGFITTFSIWTLTQSQMSPAQFPFIYIPEVMIYLAAFMVASTFWVFIAMKWRILR